MTEGKKFDTGKTRYDLLPRDVLTGVAQVMTFGAAKYDSYNWQGVELPRYLAAAERHLNAAIGGEQLDPESNVHHAFHYACNAIFIAWLLLHKPEQAKAYRDAQNGLGEP